MDKKTNFPNVAEIAGSFGHVGSLNFNAFINFADEGLPNLNSIVEDVAQFGFQTRAQIIPTTLETIDDAAEAPSTLQIDWANAVGDPTILEFATSGVAGNAWQVTMYDVGPVGAGNEVVVEDAVLEILYIGIDVGASTIGDVENAVTAAGPNITVGTASGTPAALAAAGDCFGQTAMTGGADATFVTVTGSDEAGLAYVVHFTPGTSTVGDVTTAINALVGARIEVNIGGIGTPGNVLQVGDVMPQTLLRSPEAPHAGLGFIASRAAVGQYIVVIDRHWAKSILDIRACISGTAATGKYAVVGTPLLVANVGYLSTFFIRTAAGAASDLNVANNEAVQFKIHTRRT